MSPRQRAHRLRQLDERLASLQRQQRAYEAERHQLENDHSFHLGLRVPLRGRQLLAELDRAKARTAHG